MSLCLLALTTSACRHDQSSQANSLTLRCLVPAEVAAGETRPESLIAMFPTTTGRLLVGKNQWLWADDTKFPIHYTKLARPPNFEGGLEVDALDKNLFLLSGNYKTYAFDLREPQPAQHLLDELTPIPLAGASRIGLWRIKGYGWMIACQGHGFAAIADASGPIQVRPMWGQSNCGFGPPEVLFGVGTVLRLEEGVAVLAIRDGKPALDWLTLDGQKRVRGFRKLGDAGLQIITEDGWFVQGPSEPLASAAKTVRHDRAGEIRSVPSIGALINTDEALYLVRSVDGVSRTVKVGDPLPGDIGTSVELGSGELLAGGGTKLIHISVENGSATVENVQVPNGNLRAVTGVMSKKPLVSIGGKVFQARIEARKLSLSLIGEIDDSGQFPDAGDQVSPNGDDMLGHRDGGPWFYVASDGTTSQFGTDPHHVKTAIAWPGVGVLLQGDSSPFEDDVSGSGWWLASMLDSPPRLLPFAAPDGIKPLLSRFRPLSRRRLDSVVWTREGPLVPISVTLTSDNITLTNRAAIEGAGPDDKNDRAADVLVHSACGSFVEKYQPQLILTGPNGELKSPIPSFIGEVKPSDPRDGILHFRLPISREGTWRLALRLQGLDPNRTLLLGPDLVISSTSNRLLEHSSEWLAAILVLSNLIILLTVRRSSFSWELATDEKFLTVPVRTAALVLSGWKPMVVWLLSPYFLAARKKFERSAAYVSLPLHNQQGRQSTDDLILAPPWTAEKIWIEGSSGMGKTALWRHTFIRHLQSDTALQASRRWGVVVVAFAARDYPDPGDDKPEITWVLNAIKAELSLTSNMTFHSDFLLKRMLRSGAIGIMIDGLHEANRALAVTQFAREFSQVPIVVTSQDAALSHFDVWQLPAEIHEFVTDFVSVHLEPGSMTLSSETKAAAETISRRINESGLREAIQSGYDLKLIVDLVRGDPSNAPMPKNRLDLYAKVVEMAWPRTVSTAARTTQLDQLAAAAWTMVSERKPEERRRFVKGDKVDFTLLETLASATDKGAVSVRLIRRVSSGFEFVHDLMHAYLAARWFSQPGLPLERQRAMLEASKVWDDRPQLQTSLWSFVADLLDNASLIGLLKLVEPIPAWDSLRRALKHVVEQRDLVLVCDVANLLSRSELDLEATSVAAAALLMSRDNQQGLWELAAEQLSTKRINELMQFMESRPEWLHPRRGLEQVFERRR